MPVGGRRRGPAVRGGNFLLHVSRSTIGAGQEARATRRGVIRREGILAGRGSCLVVRRRASPLGGPVRGFFRRRRLAGSPSRGEAVITITGEALPAGALASDASTPAARVRLGGGVFSILARGDCPIRVRGWGSCRAEGVFVSGKRAHGARRRIAAVALAGRLRKDCSRVSWRLSPTLNS